MAKTCSGAKVSAATMLESIEHLQSVWPYSVEVLIFPYEHPSTNYDEKNCEDFDKDYTKTGRKIYMMELAILNGPNTHPMFKFLKDVMGVEDLSLDTTQYFVMSPDVDAFEYHYGKSLLDMKDVLREKVKELDPSDEL